MHPPASDIEVWLEGLLADEENIWVVELTRDGKYFAVRAMPVTPVCDDEEPGVPKCGGWYAARDTTLAGALRFLRALVEIRS